MVNKNSYHIIEGYDPDIYYYEDLRKIHDIIFIGNATPERVREIRRLQVMSPHRKFTIFGEGWPSGDEFNVNVPVFGEDERTEINQARFVLNLVHDKFIFSDRVTKALGCGATVISQYSKDLQDLFGGIVYQYTSYEEFGVMTKSNFPLITPEESKLLAINISVLFSWKTICESLLRRVNEY